MWAFFLEKDLVFSFCGILFQEGTKFDFVDFCLSLNKENLKMEVFQRLIDFLSNSELEVEMSARLEPKQRGEVNRGNESANEAGETPNRYIVI